MKREMKPEPYEMIVRLEGYIDDDQAPDPEIFRRSDGSPIHTLPENDAARLRMSLLVHSRDGFLGLEPKMERDLRALCERGSAAYVPFQAGNLAANFVLGSAGYADFPGSKGSDQIFVSDETLFSFRAPGSQLRVDEEDLKQYLAWMTDLTRRAPETLRSTLTERLQQSRGQDIQARFTLTGAELAAMDFGKVREIVLCHGGVPEMRGRFNQNVGQAVANQPYPRAFWEGIERGTMQP